MSHSQSISTSLRPRLLTKGEDLTMTQVQEILNQSPLSLLDSTPKYPRGPHHAYQSDADYWWPDTDPSLPFVRRDGMSYPGVFSGHRRILRMLRSRVAQLAIAGTTWNEPAIHFGMEALLEHFFLDPEFYMEPHLHYSQGIQGRRKGRAPGLIDGLPFAEIAIAIRFWLRGRKSRLEHPVKTWFHHYLDFLWQSDFGKSERGRENNHAPAYWLQVTAIALLLDEDSYLHAAYQWLQEELYLKQMDVNGHFPAELARTKPLGYSIFIVNCLSLIHQTLSLAGFEDNWRFELPDGRGFRNALTWVFPFIESPENWPYEPDVQHFHAWKLFHPALFFSSMNLDDLPTVQQTNLLGTQLTPEEVDRNMPATCFPIWTK